MNKNNNLTYSVIPKIMGSTIAGLSEVSIFHPADTITKRMMISKSNTFDKNKIFLQGNLNKKMTPNNIIKSLYHGYAYASLYKVSQRVYKFGGHSVVNDFISKKLNMNTNDTLINASTGAFIGLCEVALLPLDALKIKKQTNPKSIQNRNIFDIIRKEKFKLYRGAGWTAIRNVPGSFSLFGGYTLFRNMFYKNVDNLSWTETFHCSGIGSISSLIVSSPFDIIKTRIQRESFDKKTPGRIILKNLLVNEGFKGLFKGITPKLLTITPKLVFSMTVSKKLINYFQNNY